VRKSKIKQISLAVCLALMPLSIYAAGLGRLNVNSGLGEPLKAEIELLSLTPEELSTLAATIASEEAYAAQGITRLGIHSNIKVEITKKADGSPILKLRSSQPISDPYLDMLVQVDWATGRLQREYTILLDPPGYKPESDNALVMPVELPSASTSRNGESTTAAIPSSSSTVASSEKRTTKQRKTADKTAAQELEASATGGPDQITKRGDTLSSLAKEMQVEGVSLDQMLFGLYENNQEAFSGSNMNRLKVGQIIKVPTKESLVSISTQEARKLVKVHSANWNAYRNSLAGAVVAAPVEVEAEQKQSSSGKIATAEDKAAPVKSGPQDVVKLSAGDKDTGKAFEDKMAALQEEAIAREKSLKEAQERTSTLEKQIEDMQKLLALKSQSMTDLQKNAEATAANPAEEVSVEKPVVATENKVPDTEVVTPVEVKPKPVTPKIEAQPVKSEPSMLEGLANSVDLTVIGGVSGVALLGAVWMFLRNKRRKDLDSFERGILTSGGLRANTVFGNTTGNASVSDTSFLTDFAQSADGSMIDTNDVDPIAEAEVYMAYGRDVQAEEILKDAISKEPKRYELHLKLLEMYAARKDNSAFEAIAGELYTTLGAEDPVWEKVAVLGAELEPENPLYNVSKSVALSSTASKKVDVAEFTDEAASSSNSLDDGLDFSLDGDDIPNSPPSIEDASAGSTSDIVTAQNVKQDISFDLGNIEDDSPKLDSPESPDESSAMAEHGFDNSMDFDLGEFSSAESSSVEENTLKAATDLPEFEITDIKSNDFEANPLDFSAVNEVAESKVADFDMDFNLSVDSAESGVDTGAEVRPDTLASNTLGDISFDLDFSDVVGEGDVESPVIAESEISFDIPHSGESIISAKTEESKANTFDLSGINLDVNDIENELPVVTHVTETIAESPVGGIDSESQDVNIKLDLVAAYIDMDDKEGARELLEEVIKEGGEHQKTRAKQLLDDLA